MMAENHTDNSGQQGNSKKASSSGCGCLGFILVLVAVILYLSIGKSDFYLMPGEANQSIEALQKTFDEIDQVLPDSLVITEELDPYQHYQSAESFGNIFYAVNPVLDAALKADTTKKYKFQYVARVDHVDAGEFVIKTFLVDSIWSYQPFKVESSNPFMGETDDQ
ncbi:hypothetical protein AB2B38_013620 [Balneola sp. MJW-20]|uniref:hypothetical protein n=1 Tax=Gracilimonas aurantiaca TaxID=3234185 RepID=UPI0034672EC9